MCVVAVEALVRWEHPQRGLLSPVHFVPMAEASDLILAPRPVGSHRGMRPNESLAHRVRTGCSHRQRQRLGPTTARSHVRRVPARVACHGRAAAVVADRRDHRDRGSPFPVDRRPAPATQTWGPGIAGRLRYRTVVDELAAILPWTRSSSTAHSPEPPRRQGNVAWPWPSLKWPRRSASTSSPKEWKPPRRLNT